MKTKKIPHIQVEYAYVPVKLIEQLSVEEAFQQLTGHDPIHIIHYSEDDWYDADGNLLDS